ncbi:LysR family transcriptional regulator [Acanthopleuribacter pedis]|uniref:LysR family transcriptional regulator n=1 Tax=Acanthopleuribacter pedis TaxID=442870 RepID=A0A8J7Q2A0_9BACT|nr:LysR family transcriptional regulator [Acanthopleuribacter pedis]MBO1317424.1 LysR family transcriptional regulator [Acanthopleuribacter pedis]
MTHEQLRVLQAVVEHGGFRAAAEVLFKSQPAVSKMVQKLEQTCGFLILDRDHYRPKLTREGRIFYDQAVKTLHQFAVLEGVAARLATPEENEVAVAVNAICPLDPVLRALKKVQNRFPATRIHLSMEMMGGPWERVQDGLAAFAITTLDGIDPGLCVTAPLLTVPIIPVAHRDHPAAQHTHPLSRDDVAAFVQVLVADSSRHSPEQSRDVVFGARHWRVTDISSKKHIIMAGMGWGGLPEYHIRGELADGRLVALPVEGFPIRKSQQHLVRRAAGPPGLVAGQFWDALLAETTF